MELNEEKVSGENKSKTNITSNSSCLFRDFTQSNKTSNSSNYFSRVMTIVNKVQVHVEKLEDVTIVEDTFFMTIKFNEVIYFIKESEDTDELSIAELNSLVIYATE